MTYKDISAKEGQTIEMQDDTGRCGTISRCYIQAYDFTYGFESVLSEISVITTTQSPAKIVSAQSSVVTPTTKTSENQTIAQQPIQQQKSLTLQTPQPQALTKDQQIQTIKLKLIELMKKLIEVLRGMTSSYKK